MNEIINKNNLSSLQKAIRKLIFAKTLMKFSAFSEGKIKKFYQPFRKQNLTGFSYSYYQIREMIRQSRVQNAAPINIDKQFLILDRYNFQQFYLEVGGFMNLTNCKAFFNQFTEVQTLDIALQSDSPDQSFNLQENIKSSKLTKLALNFENIQLITQNYSLQNLEEFKLTLINCKFAKQDLKRLLLTMKKDGRIILNLRQVLARDNERQQMDRSIIRSQINEDFRFNTAEMRNIQQELTKKMVKINFLL